VFLTQLLLLAATVLLVAVIAALDTSIISDALFYSGVVIVFLATGLAAAVPWHTVPKAAIVVLPLLDIVAICLMRQSEPVLGASFLLVFPVIWMSTHFGVPGGASSVLLSATLIWGGTAVQEVAAQPHEIPRLAVAPIMLVFVAATTHATTRRTAAQKVLLTHQAVLFEAALKRSRRQEQTLDEIFNAVDFGVLGFDASGRLNLVNRTHREMLDRLGDPADAIVPAAVYGDDKVTPIPDEDRPYRRALRGETVDRVTLWTGKPGTTRSAILISTRPVLDERGNFDGGVVVSRDVTPEMRAIQARDDLVASVSHELRTPLTSILGYLELAIDDDRLDSGTRQMLGVASKNADRMLALVSDLMTAASDSKAVLMLAFEPCEIGSIVNDAVESIRPIAAEREITFEVAELPVIEVEADAFRLRQVVDNILSNAVKYNMHSGSIAVTLRGADGVAELRVTDTGRGMTDDEQKNLFDRFYRADSVRGSSVHGTGLGLNISRDIMRRHGGDLRLETGDGEGATAIATLPLAK
jgi:two-component system phosphate regulon sensor histidine kinase PhoR